MTTEDVEVPMDSFKQTNDVGSVSTILSDNDSEAGFRKMGDKQASRSSSKSFVVVATLASVLGLLVGLGLAQHVRGCQSMRSVALTSGVREGQVTGTRTSTTSSATEYEKVDDPQQVIQGEMEVAEPQRQMRSTLTVRAPPQQTRSFSMSVRETTPGSRAFNPVAQPTQEPRTFSMTAQGSELEPRLSMPEQDLQPPPDFSIGFEVPSDIEWPELLGLPGEVAKRIIEDFGEGYTVVMVPPSGFTTMDLRPNRVFLFLNEAGHVARVPRPGR